MAVHKLTDPLIVVKARRKFLIVFEQLSAGVALHPRTHHVTLIVDKHLAQRK